MGDEIFGEDIGVELFFDMVEDAEKLLTLGELDLKLDIVELIIVDGEITSELL